MNVARSEGRLDLHYPEFEIIYNLVELVAVNLIHPNFEQDLR